jgi:hypothetical protein
MTPTRAELARSGWADATAAEARGEIAEQERQRREEDA